MSLIDDISFGGLGGGLTAGIVGVLLAPLVLPIVGGIARPLAKGLIKGGLMAYSTLRVAAAETMETVEDIAAEANAEIAAGNTGTEDVEAERKPARRATRKSST
jgi:hypothetical protein